MSVLEIVIRQVQPIRVITKQLTPLCPLLDLHKMKYKQSGMLLQGYCIWFVDTIIERKHEFDYSVAYRNAASILG